MRHPIKLYRWSFDMQDHVAYRPCGECEKCEGGDRDHCMKSPHLPKATAREVIIDAATLVRVQGAAHDPRVAEIVQSAGGSAYAENPIPEILALARKALTMEPFHEPVAPEYTPTCSAEYAADMLARFASAQAQSQGPRVLS